MSLNSFKFFNIFLLLLFILLPRQTFASNVCSEYGYTVLTINGILNKENDAVKNATAIVDQLGSTYKDQKLTVDYLYNPSHLGGLGDVVDVVQQGLFDQKSDYDLVEMLTDASQKINTQKVLLVAHSQGNFYANNFYEKVANQTGGIPAQSLGVYGVATPAKSVAGGGKYLTSDTDFVISTVAKKTLGGVLVPNTHINLAGSTDRQGHSFTNVYMKYAGTKIISDIQSSLNNLSSNTIQKENEQCINTPKLTLSHKVKKSVLAVADPLAGATKTVLVKTYQGATFVMNASTKTIAWLYGKSVLLARSFGKLSLLASAIPPEDLVTGAIGEIAIPDDETVVDDANTNDQELKEQNPIETENVSVGDPTTTLPVLPDEKNPDEQIDVHESGGNGGGSSNSHSDVVVSSDTTPPVITLVGDSVIEIIKDDTYVEQGATSLDDIDGARDVVIEGNVDITTLGVYTITYTASDISNNIGTATRTVNVIARPDVGVRKNFNLENKIMHRGPYVVCFPDTRTLVTSGDNIGVTDFISVTNWGTPYMQTVNTNMQPNLNMNFIFGEWPEATADCQNGTHSKDYSQTFYYATTSGDSVVFDPASFNRINSFNFEGVTPQAIGTINTTYGISVVVPAEVSLTNLVPTISVSTGATVSPLGGVANDFTTPAIYTVTAQDGSVVTYTVTVLQSSGHLKTFDSSNKIAYRGKYLLCNLDARTVFSNGDNVGVTTFVSSTNWATSFMQNANSQMSPNTNFRFIFGNPPSTTSDCTNGTHVNDYSNTFYYTTTSGSSLVYGTYTLPVLSSAKTITAVSFDEAPDDVSVSINESEHTIQVSVPFGTDVTTLTPTLSISSGATVSPASEAIQDFTNPVTYTVTAENGTTVSYVMTVTSLPAPPPDPIDTTAPTILSYTFGGTVGNITVDPVADPLLISMTASEPVDWVSVRIEKEGSPNVYKIFYSGSTCVDGTTTCTKTWGTMSKGLLSDGTYKIKISMKDMANNIFNEYLAPYTITVDTI
ncbi:MAG: immunoglobulin-like domain-containing protein [Candidatus Paceibacterota bacterium]